MRDLLKSKIFWAGLAIKFVCLFFFESYFPKTHFIPFLDQAVQNISANPWATASPEMFPYGLFLYVWLMIPKALLYLTVGDAALGMAPLSLFALKFPLLIADVALLATLRFLAPERSRDILFFYWLNPVVFYITYVYGQLDIVSMTLVVMALALLIEEYFIWAAVVFAAATASKFHVTVIAPLLMAYIWSRHFRRDAIVKLAQTSGIWLTVAAILFLPLIMAGRSDSAALGSPEIQRLFAAKVQLSENLTIYLGILATVLTIGRLVTSTRITELGLLFGSGAIFTTLLLSTNPATGWYFWCIPFLVLFYALYLNVPRILLWSFQLMFLITYPLEELGFVQYTEQTRSILYTGNITALFANVIAIWMVALRIEAPVLKQPRPFRIGIAGDSGSGKNTLTESLRDLVGQRSLSIIEGDNYHKWERGDDQWKRYTHLNPRANHLFALARHFDFISQGRPVFHNIYDHQTGRYSSPVEIKPSRILAVQGLHTLYFRRMRDMFDLRVFLSPDPIVRKAWKVRRDCIERGYDKKKVLDQLNERETDSVRFIASQAPFADIIVEYSPQAGFTAAQAEAGEIPPVSVRYSMWNDYDMSQLAQEMAKLGIPVDLGVNPSEMNRTQFTVHKEPTEAQVIQLAEKMFPDIRLITRGAEKPVWRGGHRGLSQIVLTWAMKSIYESAELNS